MRQGVYPDAQRIPAAIEAEENKRMVSCEGMLRRMEN
jgi:hypothetical protein